MGEKLRTLGWRLATLGVLLVSASCGKSASEVSKDRVNYPSEDKYEQALGAPWNGSLIAAAEFPLSGEGYEKIFVGRGAHFGTTDLLSIITHAAKTVQSKFPLRDSMKIGDISNQFGGEAKGHVSHQNGLDVDIRFFSLRGHRINFMETGFDEDFVLNGKLSTNFDLERNWYLIEYLVSTGRINRIFVDGVIKNAFCRQASLKDPLSLTSLGHLQPLENHSDHMHVRITCPEHSPRCVHQDPLPKGTGCPGDSKFWDDSLAHLSDANYME